MRARPRLRLLVVAAVGLAVAGCADAEPTMLDASDFEGVVSATHDTDGYHAPGWTWCRALSPTGYYRSAPTSHLTLRDRAEVGATIIDRSADGVGADAMLSTLEDKAALCFGGFDAMDGDTIEPLAGLDADAVGWSTAASDGKRGEFVVIRLDNARLLAVGWTAYGPESPVTLNDLIDLAREGAERVGLDG